MDIKVYSEQEKYMKFQRLRPDYVKAINVSLDLANKYLKGKPNISVADFCCGVGNNTKDFADMIGGINKAILIDINKGFLNIAKSSNINVKELVIENEDILKAKLKKECDIVFSIFAYHHVKDDEKKKYVDQVKSCLKKGGVLILTEIYLKDKRECIVYYENLSKLIPKKDHIPGLDQFLSQTANSTDFEFKVEKSFADKQFQEEGFEKLEEVQIWSDDSSKKDKGTFVQVYKLK